ncbi:MAG: hypothetical protein Q8N63_05695 [Nanoarchaeota archaeon]|nr:hypothetical protein [Nanoarchaeota archaeon]
MKRNKEDIKSAILIALDEKPLFVQQLSEKVGSNWLTINKILKELKKDGKVREIVATDKIKIFKRTDYPVFYGLPISKQYREKTFFIASEIVKEWREKNNGELPLNTTLQKIVVEVIKKCNLNLPVLPLHYGLVTAFVIKPEEQRDKIYEWIGPPESSIIIETIKKEVPKHKNKASDEEDAQYSNHNLKLFQTRKGIIALFKNGDKLDIKKLDDCLFKLYFLLPTDNSEVYNLFDNFLSSCTILFISKKPKKFLNEIREAFDILWDLITASMFLKNARKFVSPEDISLFELIRSFHLNSKMCTAEERVSNLESIASSINPDELDVPMDKDSIEIRRILAEGAEEE